ncbi:MAG: LPS assembly lipoprotein LptE [Vicinamibacterales bacterium]
MARICRLGRYMVIVLLCSLMSGCGYALAGRGGFLPDYIETIAIPIFDNNTVVFDVERLLTQEVRSAFIGRGSYRVQTDPGGADATLTGVINDITITPASFTSDQQASRYIFTLTAAINLPI